MNKIIEHTRRGDAEHLILFVHGFTGGEATFRSNEGRHMYELFERSWADRCNFSSFLYHTRLIDLKLVRKVIGWMPVVKRWVVPTSNRDLLRYVYLLETHYEVFRSRYRTVSVIGHSMGGIIAKHFVARRVQVDGGFNGFYISLATPHRGVEQARILGRFLGNVHVSSLAPFNKTLEELENVWEKTCGGINCHYYAAVDDDIVDELSAAPREHVDKLTRVDGTHVTICKPESPSSVLIKHLSLKIPVFLGLPRTVGRPMLDSFTREDVLFISYRSDIEPFYLEREEDRRAADVLEYGNLWIHGPSGIGKTNLVQRLGSGRLPGVSTYIDLSPCAMGATSDSLLEFVYVSLCDRLKAVPEPLKQKECIMRIADLLQNGGNGKRHTLILDEVPLVDEEQNQSFVQAVVALTHYVNSNAQTKARLVLASISRPKALPAAEGKFNGLFVVNELRQWSPRKVAQLLDILLAHLPLDIGSSDRAEIVENAQGNPRRLKGILRKLLLLGAEIVSIEAIARELSSEMQ